VIAVFTDVPDDLTTTMLADRQANRRHECDIATA
jgi:hypothetical protein